MQKEKLWLIRGKDWFKNRVELYRGTRPEIGLGGEPTSGNFETSGKLEHFCRGEFAAVTGLKLNPGQCIEILGFKVLTKKKAARR